MVIPRRLLVAVLGLSLPLFGARLLAAQEPEQDNDPQARWLLERPQVYVGEQVLLTLELSIDARFRAERMVRLHLQDLDLPLQLDAPFLREPAQGKVSWPTVDGEELAVNGERRAVAIDAHADGREQRRLLVHWVPAEPGSVALGPAELRYAWATRFSEDFLEGRMPVDPRDARLAIAGPTLEVLPLPRIGRPADFGGAVGVYTLHAELEDVEPDADGDLAAGEAVVLLRLEVAGQGALADLVMPPLDDLPGLRVRGRRAGAPGVPRVFHYELIAAPGVGVVPELRLPFFDPTVGEYRLATTAPLRFRAGELRAPDGADSVVEAASASALRAAVLPPLDGSGARDRHVLQPWWWLMPLLLALPWLLGPLLVGVRLRRQRVPSRRYAAALRHAAREVLASGDAALQADADALLSPAFSGLLALFLGSTTAAVHDPGLAQRLRDRGCPADLAERATELHRILVGQRYGDRRRPEAASDLRTVIEQLSLTGIRLGPPPAAALESRLAYLRARLLPRSAMAAVVLLPWALLYGELGRADAGAGQSASVVDAFNAAQDGRRAFLAGEVRLAADHFRAALTRADSGRGVLHHAAGLALAEAGDLPGARAELLGAAAFLPGDDEVRAALAEVEARLGVAAVAQRTPRIAPPPPGTLPVFAALLLQLGGLLLCLSRRVLFGTRVVGFLLLLSATLIGGALFLGAERPAPVRLMVVGDGGALLRSAPRASAPATARLAPGTAVEVPAAATFWIPQDSADSARGWVEENGLLAVDGPQHR